MDGYRRGLLVGLLTATAMATGRPRRPFQIPSLIRTNRDTLIAFVEGRAANNEDFGNINLVYKRSTDNGATWSRLAEVIGSGQGTWGNPTAVVDRSNNRICL